MSAIKQLFSLCVSASTFVFTFYVVGQLMWFLSKPFEISKQHVWILNLMDSKSRLETTYPVLVMDMLYIILFILQHSLMTSNTVKQFIRNIGLDVLQRSIYSLSSSFVLLYLIRNWERSPSIILWQIDINATSLLWWSYTILHVFAWLVIYCGSLIMDLPEIIGIKQVYYDLKHYAEPIKYKSVDLRHLYEHVRHPSFTGFNVILWCTNVMSADRFLLSTMLTLYMYIAWSTDNHDVVYQKCQLKRKNDELQNEM